MKNDITNLTAVVLDWAGTTVDYGSRAPAGVFVETFRQMGVPITIDQAREPMGRAKRDHIAAIAAIPEVAAAWRGLHGTDCNEADIDAMFLQFLPLQKQALAHGSDVISGVPEAVNRLREMGLKIGSTTGYTRDLMLTVSAIARSQGYEPDCVVCAGDTRRGRPAPFMLYSVAEQLDVYPMWSIVKVDDTPVGIEAGRHAGCWTVGVTRTGNCVGLSASEIDELAEDQVRTLCRNAEQRLRQAGAHFIVESVAELPDLLPEIEERCRKGQSPIRE